MWTVTFLVPSPVLIRVTCQWNNLMLLPQSPSSSRLRWHPLAIALLLSTQVCPLAASCLSVTPPLAIGLTALSPSASERMRHPDFLLHVLPWGPCDLTWSPFFLLFLLSYSAPSFSLTVLSHAPFLALRHSWLVSARGHCCSLFLEFSLLGSLYGWRS